ncbi:hypothetical protein ABZ914_27690 [Spirillospora sp. NPDC046719]
MTVLLCRASSCPDSLSLLENLRETIRDCPHGVLVTTGCLHSRVVRAHLCRLPGATVTVQPCTRDRRPVGSAVHIGPIRSATDVAALCTWLRSSDHDPQGLPARLRRAGPRRTAPLN